VLAPATLAALQSTRAIPDRGAFYVARPTRSIETRSLPALARRYPRHFTFYVADPFSSIHPSYFLLFTCFSAAQPLSKLLRSFAGAVSSDTRNVEPRSHIRRRLMRMVECNEMMSALS
jgi:hypothetical protein